HFLAMMLDMNTIPGVTPGWIPDKGMQAACELYKIVFKQAIWLLGFIMLISFGASVLGLGRGWIITDVFHQALFALLLLVGINPIIFGGTVAIGGVIADKIYPDTKIASLTKNIQRIAKKVRDSNTNNGSGITDTVWSWYDKLA